MKYLFPRNNRATSATILEQSRKIVEEAYEVLSEATSDDQSTLHDLQLLEEAFDVYQALEGLISKFDDVTIQTALNNVIIKSYKRGDYSHSTTTQTPPQPPYFKDLPAACYPLNTED